MKNDDHFAIYHRPRHDLRAHAARRFCRRRADHHRAHDPHFGTLLERGVRIYEYDRTLLHQKVIVVDGVWSCVGSTKFDDRSFQLNDEVSMGAIDPAVAAKLRSAFQADLRRTRERKFGEWRERGLWHQFVDGVAYLGRSQL